MSRIVSEILAFDGISHVVEAFDGNQYVVSSVKLDLPDYMARLPSYETMIFRWDKTKQQITDWNALGVVRYFEKDVCVSEHNDICENIEGYFERRIIK